MEVLVPVVGEDVGGEGDKAGSSVLGHSLVGAQQALQLSRTQASLEDILYIYYDEAIAVAILSWQEMN